MKTRIINVLKESERKKTPASYELLAKNLLFYSQQRLEIEKKEKKAKEELAKYIDETAKADEKGNRFFRFQYEGKRMLVVRQARKSVSVSIAKLKSYFASDVLSKIVKETVVESVDEAAIEQMISDESMSMEDLEACTDTKVIYATVIQEEKSEEEEDVSKT